MNPQWIEVRADDGPSFKAYLSLPPTGHGPGILLIQEIFGVNRHIRAVADQYALAGFTVLAPDLFWRSEPGLDIGYGDADRQRGMALLRGFDFARGVDDLAAAAAALRSHPACLGRIASVGFCLGGTLSYLCAARGAVDAAVCYYGGGIDRQLGLAAQVKVPILFHFAGLDQHIGPAAVAAVQEAFGSRANAAVHVYPAADHGFNCWDRGAWHQPSSALALGRSMQFLAQPLG